MPLISTRSMLQETVLRLNSDSRIMPPVVISNAAHRFIIAAQLQELGIRPTAHVLEPVGRNTAPAAAVALQIVLELDAARRRLERCGILGGALGAWPKRVKTAKA
jgi:mannose-1-phosphate guanylyltransferase/mannose-6-phosphate isomerase